MSGSDSRTTSFADRRKSERYRLMSSILLRRSDGTEQAGMSLEISEGGMSIATQETLKVGETVELNPVAQDRVSAIIRHKQGRIYGFEFLNMTPDHKERIRTMCKCLPLFSARSLHI